MFKIVKKRNIFKIRSERELIIQMDYHSDRYNQMGNMPNHGLEMNPTTLVHDINHDINSSIELVKRMRLDLMKLDNEIKSSRQNLGPRKGDEFKQRQELEMLTAQFNAEKEQIYRESVRLKELIHTVERNVIISESAIEDLRKEGRDTKSKITDIDSDIEKTNRKKTQLQEQLLETQKNIELGSEKFRKKESVEEKVESLEKKCSQESENNSKISLQIKTVKRNYESLFEQNEKLSEQLKNKLEQNSTNSKNTKTTNYPGVGVDNLRTELRRDLLLFENLKTNMKITTMEVQSITVNEEKRKR